MANRVVEIVKRKMSIKKKSTNEYPLANKLEGMGLNDCHLEHRLLKSSSFGTFLRHRVADG